MTSNPSKPAAIVIWHESRLVSSGSIAISSSSTSAGRLADQFLPSRRDVHMAGRAGHRAAAIGQYAAYAVVQRGCITLCPAKADTVRRSPPWVTNTISTIKRSRAQFSAARIVRHCSASVSRQADRRWHHRRRPLVERGVAQFGHPMFGDDGIGKPARQRYRSPARRATIRLSRAAARRRRQHHDRPAAGRPQCGRSKIGRPANTTHRRPACHSRLACPSKSTSRADWPR